MPQIPSFLFNSAPTAKQIVDCQTLGLIVPAVRAFASYEDWQKDHPFYSKLGFMEGPAKFWANPTVDPSRLPQGACFLSGKTHFAANMSLFENTTYSQAARNFYAERPYLVVPEIVGQKVEVADWGRISFNDGLFDPQEYPLGELGYPGLPNIVTSVVLFMIDGKPWVETIDTAVKMFPVKNVPTGTGTIGSSGSYSASDLVNLATKMNSGSSVRQNVANILSSGTNEEKAAKLVKL